MNKNIFKFMIIMIFVVSLTGCGNKINGNCHSLECLNSLKTSFKLEDVNKILGFDGEATDELRGIYYWKISDVEGIKATFKEDSCTLTADYDALALKDETVDFSKYDELKLKVNAGITYDEFIKYIGGSKGTIIERTSKATKYTWVSEAGEYLIAAFDDETKICQLVYGDVK